MTNIEVLDATPEAKTAFKPGKNTIAVHCHQTTGGQYVDVTVAEITPGKK